MRRYLTMPNDNSVGGEINQLRKILREVREIKRMMQDGSE
jgi:hypothetical protein